MKNEGALAAVGFIRTIRFIASRNRNSTITECRAIISALRIVTENAEIAEMNAERDLTTLLLKLGNAMIRLDQGHLSGVIHELIEFQDKVLKLDAEGKIDHDDAASLVACANDSIACIEIYKASSYKQMPLSGSNEVGYEDKEPL